MFFISIGIFLFIYLTCMVLFAQYKGDTSIANFTWGGGVLLVALYTFFTTGSFLSRQVIVTLMIVAWASRLIMHVYRRYTGNDPRFKDWKWQGLKALMINCIWIYGQIIMIAIMSYPIVLINGSWVPECTFSDFCGILLWIFGYVYEAVSDRQLFTFMKNPANKGHVMRQGLWRYSRHPNYFGETLMWWGIFMMALSVPLGWTAIIAPLTITIMLRFVTGVPLLEHAMRDNAEYREYARVTNTFVPWFVANKKS
jgi:steroid 5-alpha reductase family enzyme